MQQNNQVSWVHEDPVAKSKRVTNSSGNVVSTIELDPWGGDTSRSSNEAFQPRRFTTYDRDGNNSDEAMNRRYNRWQMRFDQGDPYGGSYEMTDPQSFNRYSYVQNDPVNFVDPLGLEPEQCGPGDMCYIFGPPLIRGGSGGAEDTGIVIESGPEQDPPGGSPSGGGIVPGNGPLDDPDTNCFVLQDIAQATTERLKGATPVVEVLRDRFVERSGEPPSQEFRSSGFKREFRDSGTSPNQVRHYVGIMSTAYKAGLTAYLAGVSFEAAFAAALIGADLRETGGTHSNRVDQRLNIVAVGHAMRLAYGRLGIAGLAKAILDEVCDQSTF